MKLLTWLRRFSFRPRKFVVETPLKISIDKTDFASVRDIETADKILRSILDEVKDKGFKV